MDITPNIDIERALYDAISAESGIPAEKLSPELTLEELNLSSVDTSLMFFDLEEYLDITLEPDKLGELSTLGELRDYLAKAYATK